MSLGTGSSDMYGCAELAGVVGDTWWWCCQRTVFVGKAHCIRAVCSPEREVQDYWEALHELEYRIEDVYNCILSRLRVP